MICCRMMLDLVNAQMANSLAVLSPLLLATIYGAFMTLAITLSLVFGLAMSWSPSSGYNIEVFGKDLCCFVAQSWTPLRLSSSAHLGQIWSFRWVQYNTRVAEVDCMDEVSSQLLWKSMVSRRALWAIWCGRQKSMFSRRALWYLGNYEAHVDLHLLSASTAQSRRDIVVFQDFFGSN